MRLPKIPGRIKKRTDGAMKRRAEEESMRELRYPTKKPSRKRPERPERPKFTPKPLPMPMPRPDRPNMKPMPYKKPRLPKEIEKFFMDLPRRMRPALMKDGGEMITGKFGKATSEFLTKAMTKGGLGAMGVSAETLKKAFEKAKKLKPSGRLNVDDIKKAIDSMKKAKKIDMSPGRRKAMTGSTTGKTRAEKLAQSIKDRPMRQKLRRKTRRVI